MKTTLWLDDLRNPRDYGIKGPVFICTTAEQAILSLGADWDRFEIVDLDHDLGPPEAGTGMDVLEYIREQCLAHGKYPPRIKIHSANGPARDQMQTAIDNLYERYGADLANGKEDEYYYGDEHWNY